MEDEPDMKAKKEKGFRRLVKSHVGSVFFIILLCTIALSVFLAFFVSFFFQYVIENRVVNEYRSISYMARLYDDASAGDTVIFRTLDREGRTYLIRNKDGKILHQNGENTCSEQGMKLDFLPDAADVTVYTDTSTLITELKFDHNKLTFDLSDMVQGLVPQYIRTIFTSNADTVSFPLWISVPLRGGSQILYGKMFFSMNRSDLLFLTAFLGVISFLVLFGVVTLIISTITSIVKQRKLTNLFYMDDVTGGKNWMWFQTNAEKLLKKQRNMRNRYAILNLVFIKYRNFCVCHSIAEGEHILMMIEQMIHANIGRRELCAHYASADFAILLQYTDEEELRQRVWNLITLLEQLDHVHRFSFRVGIDTIDVQTDRSGHPVRRKSVDLERKFNNACTARATLESSDDSGLAFFNQELVEEQRWTDIVHEKQESALANEEFQVYYQPKYDPRTRRLCGAEALIRWISPEYGFKGPGAFIPIFEQNGFITEIDHYMLKHVSRDQKRWLDQGYDCVPVSVNVSRAHFIESNLAEQIRDIVDQSGTPRNLIEIELTESAFFDDKKALVTTISRLKEYGFTVSMDDFGSGYSSLNSLKDMPLDVLKLDAEFFRSETEDGRDRIVVSEAIRLAKNLNMRTVAEGVEIQDQVDFLAEQGCDMIQGYVFAKPMPGTEFEERMKAGEVIQTTEQPPSDAP